MGLGVGIQVGNVLEGRLGINNLFPGGIKDCQGLGGMFGTNMGSESEGNLLGNIVELLDGNSGGLALETIMLGSQTGFDRSRKDVDDKGNEFGVQVGWPGDGTSACDGDGKFVVSCLVGSGVKTGDSIGIGDERGIAEALGVGTVLVGLLGFGNGSKDDSGVIAILVGLGVNTDDGIGLGCVDGIAGRREVGSVVADSLVTLGDGIVVCLGGGLGDNVGIWLGIGVLSTLVRLGIGIFNGVVSGTGVIISLVGLEIGGAGTGDNIVGQDNSMGGGGRDGAEGFGFLVGAGVGNDDGIELGDVYGIVDGLDFGTGLLVGVWVGAVAGVRLGGGVVMTKVFKYLACAASRMTKLMGSWLVV